MALIPPKRLFNITTLSTVMYDDVVDDVKEKGYIAVSHVWGDQKLYTADDLGVSGVEWKIPLSDSNKMSRLKNAMNHFEMEYCWFDVLCMPQDKQNEINLEIPFMGDYYSGANITIVLSDREYIISEDLTKWQDMMLNVMKTHREFTLDEEEWIIGDGRHILLDISEDDWFERVWTLQETVLSKNVVYIGPNGSRLCLTNIFLMTSYMTTKHLLYVQTLFGSNLCAKLVGLGQAISGHNSSKLDLMRVYSTVLERNCKRIQDRFYGLLGILGYKDFVVNYDISMKDLNKEIVKHAYSKRDLSWMTVERGIRTGFVQPIYREYTCFGTAWKAESGITLKGDNLIMDVTKFGRVVYRATFVDDDLPDVYAFVKWVVDVFRRWKFDDATIFRTITGYYDMSDEYIKIGIMVLDHIVRDLDMKFMLDDDIRMQYLSIIENIKMVYVSSGIRFIVGVELVYGRGFHPLMISGDVDPLDEIVVPKISDCRNRRLGIVTSHSSKRKGVCFIPPDIGSHIFIPYIFPL